MCRDKQETEQMGSGQTTCPAQLAQDQNLAQGDRVDGTSPSIETIKQSNHFSSSEFFAYAVVNIGQEN